MMDCIGGERVSKRLDVDLTGGLDEQWVMYYNAGWQLVEAEIYEGWSSGSPGTVDQRRAWFWGARYIDDAIEMLVDDDNDGDYWFGPLDAIGDFYYFFLHDAQFSTVAVLDDAANLEERITYDAYGRARHHDWRDRDGDGDYDSSDPPLIFSPSGYPITDPSYAVDFDLDRDGDLDSTDLTLGGTSYPTPLTRGELSYAAIGNIVGYDGYLFNREMEQYTVRHRHYDPVLGRWIERDPIAPDTNAYLYCYARPPSTIDPSGLIVILIHGVNTEGEWFGDAESGLTAFWNSKPTPAQCPQAIIKFYWGPNNDHGGGSPDNATGDVASMQDQTHWYMWNAVNRYAQLLKWIADARGYDNSKEPINIIAHSQGTVITVAALQRAGVQVDNVIFLGSPLGNRDDLNRIRSNVRQLYNYYSPKDLVLFVESGRPGRLYGSSIGQSGSDVNWVTDRLFDDFQTINGFTLPAGPPGGPRGLNKNRHSWYMSDPNVFTQIFAKDLAPATSDTLLSTGNLMRLAHWRRTADTAYTVGP